MPYNAAAVNYSYTLKSMGVAVFIILALQDAHKTD